MKLAMKLADIVDAFEFVNSSAFEENQAYVRPQDGRIIWVSEIVDMEEDEDLPDEPEAAGYLAIPHRRDLDLGAGIALVFTAERLPDSIAEVSEIFRRKGAWRRFKDFLHAKGVLEEWYAFEAKETENALRKWCRDAGVTLTNDSASI
jgi:hypothetical protein